MPACSEEFTHYFLMCVTCISGSLLHYTDDMRNRHSMRKSHHRPSTKMREQTSKWRDMLPPTLPLAGHLHARANLEVGRPSATHPNEDTLRKRQGCRSPSAKDQDARSNTEVGRHAALHPSTGQPPACKSKPRSGEAFCHPPQRRHPP